MVTIFVAVYDRDPLENWCKGRFCLIGDAAHAMSQFAGQGANMAVIDGFLIATMVLSELKKASLTTSGSVPTEKINQEFKDFEKIRKPSASKVLNQARQTADYGGSSCPKSWFFRSMIKIMPNNILSTLVFKADEENDLALLCCGIEIVKVSFFGTKKYNQPKR